MGSYLGERSTDGQMPSVEVVAVTVCGGQRVVRECRPYCPQAASAGAAGVPSETVSTS